MATIANLVVKLDLEDNTFQSKLQDGRDKLDSWGRSLRGIGTKLTAGVTTPLLAAGGVMVNWASDLDQAMGKSEAVFGDHASTVQEWSKSTASAYGFARSESLGMASTYGSLFKVMGLGNEVAADYSMQLIGLSADMAAFNDVSNDRASQALMAGLTGEYESLKSMGVFLNEATVNQEALTIAQAAGREEITEADKVQARYNLILKQTAQQQGQAARESDNWASRLAQVRARVKDVGASIGARLMPFALKLLDHVEGLVDWFDKLSPSMQKWATIIGVAAAAAGPLLIAIGMLLPGLSALLGVIGFLISPIGLVVAAIAALAAGAIYAYQNIEPFREAVDKVASALLDLAENAIEKVVAGWNKLKDAFDADGWSGVWDTIVQAVQDGLRAILDAITGIDWMGVLSAAWDVLSGAGSWLIEKLGDLAGSLWSWFWGAVTGVDWGGVLSTAWDVLTGVAGWIVEKIGQAATLTAGLFSWAWDAISGVDWSGIISGAWSALKNAGQWVLDMILTYHPAVLTAKLFMWAWDALHGVDWGAIFKLAINVLKDAGQWIVDKVQTGAAAAYEGIKSWASGIWDGIIDALEPIISTAVGYINDLIGALNQIPGVKIDPIKFGFEGLGISVGGVTGQVKELKDELINLKWDKANAGPGGTSAAPPAGTSGGTGIQEGGGGSGMVFDEMRKSFDETRISAALLNTEIGRTPPIISAVGSTSPVLSGWADIGKGAFTSTGESARTNLSPIGGMAASMAAALTGAAIPAFTGVSSSAGSNFASMLSAARSNFGSMKSTASSESSAMNRDVAFQTLGMKTAALLQMASLKATSALHFTSMAQTSKDQATAMSSAMRRGAGDAAKAVDNGLSRIPGIVRGVGGSAESAALQVGVNIGDAMARGMESMLGRIQSAAAAMVTAASAALVAKAMISSPSRLFMGYGEYVGEGFELGIRSMIPDAARAASDLVATPSMATIPGFAHVGAERSQQPQTVNNYYAYALTATEMDRLLHELDNLPAHTIEIIRAGKRNVGTRR